MSLFELGKTSGLALDSGDGSMSIVPVIDGKAVSDAVVVNDDLSGQKLTTGL